MDELHNINVALYCTGEAVKTLTTVRISFISVRVISSFQLDAVTNVHAVKPINSDSIFYFNERVTLYLNENIVNFIFM